MSASQPRIITTIFILGDLRKYNLDVNENITFHTLKKMIASASNLEKIGIRIWHNSEEFTQYEEETLVSKIPNENPITFQLAMKSKFIDNYERLLKVRYNQEFCKLHEGKYSYFYCFNCRKNICSECILTGEHKYHEIKEMYDYLQNLQCLYFLLAKLL